MTKEIQQTQTFYECEGCKNKYAEKEWAEKCEAWCKENRSSHLEITEHAIKDGVAGAQAETKNSIVPKEFLTALFYTLLGVVSSLGLFLVLYWSLRLNSSITSLVGNTRGEPLYLWLYGILTIGTIVLFGISVPLLVYRWRKYGMPKLKDQAGTGGGSVVAVFASACPVCGSSLLAAIGIAGGLAAFPFGGLELKALSFGLMALPIWLITKDMKKLKDCGPDGMCPIPRDASFKKEKDMVWLGVLAWFVFAFSLSGWGMLKSDPIVAKALAGNKVLNLQDNALNNANLSETDSAVFNAALAEVLPEEGFQSKLVLGDAVVKLTQRGVIDSAKFEKLYRERTLPPELENILTEPSNEPILLTQENANYYVNLLWPLGLANYMSTNKESPLNGDSLFNLASTGGWTLGKAKNGGEYFNKFNIVDLTPEQEALATKIAKNTYRPCCNNSTFYQDCNHGSALLGVLQLGAAQGLTEDELYREALAFNSFWFPDTYIQTAIYFKQIEGVDWKGVDPKIVMGEDYSTISAWRENVQKPVASLDVLPKQQGGASCGV